jgi:exopolyphosphatase/guanosine-5'-triphosphate,3'-diphosphate pyrophosphatase
MDRQKQKHRFDLHEQLERLAAVRTFARQCNYEAAHSEQVVFLAECLFDRLNPICHFSPKQRFWLTCGAILHDIGWKEGQQKHHKTSMRMILSDMTMPLDLTERKMIALIARYHRKSLPRPSHPVYSDCSDKQRQTVELLAGMVRLADGLDQTHTEAIKELTVDIQHKRIRLVCKSNRGIEPEINYGRKKTDLLQRATGCTVEILGAASS